MNTPNQVVARIRFELEQLTVRNAHHEFENLCRHLARSRICSNILPATGPVSAGGDQGRDFETFRTYLRKSPISDSTFLGLVSQGPMAFACTLTKGDGLSQKIKSDVTTIVSSGTRVIDIHYFCTADLSVGNRHKLQQWVIDSYQVHLEIYDGQAISELLAERDIFWIAQQFLNIPADTYPTLTAEEEEEWYTTLVQTWKARQDNPQTFAEFFQIKDALRHAYSDKGPKQDILFWVQKLESIPGSTPFPSLERKVVYEIVVASLRGMGTMVGQEERLRSYFSEIPQLLNVSDIEDAAVLLTFCVGALYANVIALTADDLSRWRSSLIDKIETELEVSAEPGRRCALLNNRAYLHVVPTPHVEQRPDIDSAIKCWLEIASIVDRAPLFPLENFADNLTELLRIAPDVLQVSGHPDFKRLTQRIDQLLSDRCGGFVAAEKCRDRAIALYEKGEVLRALKEIHFAKLKWFSEETLRGSILATLFASMCYLDLGLIFAAKYYALTAASIALHSDDEKVKRYASRAVIEASACDHLNGAFFGFLDLTDIGLKLFGVFSERADSTDLSNEINRTLFHSSVVRFLAQRIAPDWTGLIDSSISRWTGLEEDIDDLTRVASEVWSSKSLQEVWESLEEQMLGRPFSDTGAERRAEFTALGITWKFQWENTYELTCLAEELLAAIQVCLADLADTDLCLLPTVVDVTLESGPPQKIGVVSVPSNDSTKWKVTIGDSEAGSDATAGIVSIASTLLFGVSLLPRNKLLARLESAFQDGLSSKAFFIRRYKTLYGEFIDKAAFDKSDRRSKAVPEANRPFRGRSHAALQWQSGPGPGYSRESADDALRNRYKNSIVPVRHTLKRLSASSAFRDTVRVLRQQGWLDWHILNAVVLAAINYRLSKELTPADGPRKFQERFLELMNAEELETDEPVPGSEFSEDALRFQLYVAMVSTLKGLGLELHQETPDFPAISRFLGARYNYWKDDIEHEDFGF